MQEAHGPGCEVADTTALQVLQVLQVLTPTQLVLVTHHTV